MNAQDTLRQEIDRQQDRLCAGIPVDSSTAIFALLRRRERLPNGPQVVSQPDLVTGHRLPDLGGNKALQLCFQSDSRRETTSSLSNMALESWAERFLRACEDLAAAELILVHAETGFMRLGVEPEGQLAAWIATRRMPTSWRERADIDWWAQSIAREYEPQLRDLRSGRRDVPYPELANMYLKMMAHQPEYPPGTEIDGCSIQTCREVLGGLIARALQARDCGELAVVERQALVSTLASDLDTDPGTIDAVLSAFTLDRENAGYHAAVPGVAPAPIVRLSSDRVVLSAYGLTSEPLFFLTRELRRRDATAYHNAAFLREDIFRQDLYRLFDDKRFVTSVGRINLRRTNGGVRTDIDAAVFDRKTGTLGLFELKSQDPYARSTAALERQRDNVLYANRQLSGVLDWINRHGADEILNRIDTRTARTFHVQKVFPFVLGRYLATFSDGAAPDSRAAWGTWPQLLRLIEDQPARKIGANPIATLFTRLANDASSSVRSTDPPSREIILGGTRLVVHPSYDAFKANSGVKR